MKRFKFLIVLLILLILPIASCSIGETSTTNKNYPATSSTTSSTNDSGHSLNNVKLEDKVFVYDGKVHSLEVTNLPKGYTIIYGHLTNQVLVSVGQSVSQGQHIGYMGNSGSSTGTHLHFQIDTPSGTSLDPCVEAFRC